ncbi:MAG: hypothetical protein LBI29_03695, partial [Rickettsiales bacterium]|nr:hypothetical protein [Rickettsiales bacterium]
DELDSALAKAKTDSEKLITYDPDARPEVANLLVLASLVTNRKPDQIAGEIGNGGAKALKELLLQEIDRFLTPIRERRRELERDPERVTKILKTGIARVRDEASQILSRVLLAMNTHI